MDWSQVLAGGGMLGGVVLVVAAPRIWKPLRRIVAVIDALAGRPPRYDGDPEARPGLVEQLDRIHWHVGNGSRQALREVVDELRRDVAELRADRHAEQTEESTKEGSGDAETHTG